MEKKKGRRVGAGRLAVIAFLTLTAGCASTRRDAWRALADRATLLAIDYEARAESSEDEMLTAALHRGAAAARKIAAVCLLDHRNEASNLARRGGLAGIDVRLCEVEGQVAEAIKLSGRRERLVARLRLDRARTAKLLAAETDAKKARALLTRQATIEADLRTIDCNGKDPSLTAIITEIEERRAAQDPDPAAAERHGYLKARVDEEIKRVVKALADEPEVKASESRRERLKAAQSKLERAKASLAGDRPSAFRLDEAQRSLQEAETAIATNAQDPILYTSNWFRAHAGAIALSPYELRRNADGRFELNKSGDQTTAYLELDFFGREAWLSPEDRLDRNADVGLDFIAEWAIPDDYEARLRFLDDSGTSIDDAESAAGGDISLETSVGWNIVGIGLRDRVDCLRNPQDKKLPQGTINLDVGAGFVTDRDTIDGHGYLQAGLATVWSIPLQLTETKWRPATVYTFLGYGIFDFPKFDTDLVQYEETPLAQFSSLGALSARMDVSVPLAGSFDAVAGIRYWDPLGSSRTPEAWSVFVGVSLPLGRILNAVSNVGDS